MKLNHHTYMLGNIVIATVLAMAIAGCDQEESKSAADAAAVSKVAEGELANPVATPEPPLIPVAAAPASQTPASPPPKPAVVLSNDKSGLVNVAKGKVTEQSSGRFGAISSRAVDGNVDGKFMNSSVTHTSGNEVQPWLVIDLGESENIDHINVWNRTDCCSERLANYWIFISDTPFSPAANVESLSKAKGVMAIKGGPANPSFTATLRNARGRYVRLQLVGSSSGSGSVMSVAEVEVYRAR